MNTAYIYEFHVEGYLSDRWADWFEGLAIDNHPNGETILKGWVVDQAALFGVLNKIQSLNLTLISVNRASTAK
jgi:haloalkane dehalogenase